ncbi:MAG: Rrf2 family transcriptional regulator [Candidatus Aenigmarchaeota archaeon]|nr:Rrf2 family transcriptional regulator [Candidatus Aenigmarchaeota archaeon]
MAEQETGWFDLSIEQRFSTLISALGNDLRNVMVAHVLPRQAFKDRRQIAADFSSFVDASDKRLKMPIPTSIESHLNNVLVPLWAEESPDGGSWRLTQAGYRIAAPAAAHAIATSVELGTMNSILGFTKKGGFTTSPYKRAIILENLYETTGGDGKHISISESDLQRRIGFRNSSLSKHLPALKDAGMVKYDSVSAEDMGAQLYKWKEGRPEDVPPLPKFAITLDVARALKNSKDPMDYKSIASMLGIPPTRVSTVLNYLSENGYVESVSGFVRGKKMSVVKISDNGVALIDRFIEPLRATSVTRHPSKELRDSSDIYGGRRTLAVEHNTAVMVAYQSELTRGETNRHSQVIGMLGEKPMRIVDIEEVIGVPPARYLRDLVAGGYVQKRRGCPSDPGKGHGVWYSRTSRPFSSPAL